MKVTFIEIVQQVSEHRMSNHPPLSICGDLLNVNAAHLMVFVAACILNSRLSRLLS